MWIRNWKCRHCKWNTWDSHKCRSCRHNDDNLFDNYEPIKTS